MQLDKCRTSVKYSGQIGVGAQHIGHNEEALKEAVAMYGPVAVGIYGSDDSFRYYSEGRII